VAKRRGALVGGISAGSKSKSNPVAYAAIIQSGGKVGPHVIRSRAKALVFKGRSGDTVVTATVNHPGATIQAQNYLRINEGRLSSGLDGAYQRAIDREFPG
jgi:hypothetical protein